MLDKPEVWRALAQDMPMMALVRNLATLTRVGVIAPMDSAEVCERLRGIGNPTVEDYARIHPISIFTTSELSLHRCPAVKARGVATSNNPCRSGHGS